MAQINGKVQNLLPTNQLYMHKIGPSGLAAACVTGLWVELMVVGDGNTKRTQGHKPTVTSGLGSSHSRVVSVSLPSQAGMQEPAHRSMTVTGKSLEPGRAWLGELGASSLQKQMWRRCESCPFVSHLHEEKMKWPASV